MICCLPKEVKLRVKSVMKKLHIKLYAAIRNYCISSKKKWWEEKRCFYKNNKKILLFAGVNSSSSSSFVCFCF